MGGHPGKGNGGTASGRGQGVTEKDGGAPGQISGSGKQFYIYFQYKRLKVSYIRFGRAYKNTFEIYHLYLLRNK